MPSNFDDVVRKNKQYLTQAQVNALAAAAKEYNIQNAGNRAGALASVREQYGTGYRGLQNMGLAGNISGADTSGEVPRLRQKIAEPFGAYNRSLQDVENKRLSALGGQMAQETRAARAAEAAARAAALAAAQANLGSAMRIGAVAGGLTGAAGAAQNAANKYQLDGMKRTAQVYNDAELSAQIASKQVPGVSAEDLIADKKKKAAYSAAVAAQYRGMKQTADVIDQQNQQKVNTYLDAQYRGLKQTAAAQAQLERENIANRAAAEILGVRTPTAYERAEQTRLQREAAASRNEQAARNGQTIGERIGEAHLNRQLLSDDPRGIQRTEAEEALRVFNAGLKTGYDAAEDKQALDAAQKKVDALASVRDTSARPGAEEAYQQAVRQRDIAQLKVEDPKLYAFMVVSGSDLPADTKKAAGEKFMERFDDDRQEAGRLYTEASQKYDAAVRQWKGETSTTQEQSVTDALAMYDDAVKSKSQTRIDAAEQQLRKLGYTSAEAARKAVEEQAQKEQQDAEKYEEVSQIVAELKAATTEYENATKYSEDPYAATGANRKIQELGQVLMNYYGFKEPEDAEAWLAKYEEQHKEPADVDEDEQYRYYKRLLDIVDTDYKDRTPVEKGLLADAEDFDEDEARKFVADYESEKSQAQQAAPDYVTQAQQERAQAEFRYKNPDTYRAVKVLQFKDLLQNTNPEVVEWAAGKVADYEYGQMGFKVPKMTDEEYAEAKEKAPAIQEIIDRIDSARLAQEQKAQTKTTGSVDYWQRDIDELVAELKSEYGMTEDEARSMVERYRADKDARSEKNYYYPGMLAQVNYSGMTQEKPVNNNETDDVYRYINGLSTLKMSGMVGMAESSIPEDKRVAKWMTDEQKATYNAIYEQDGIEAANKYFQDIIPYLNIQRAMQDEAFYKQLADEHPPIVADIASVGANMLWNIPAALDRLMHGAMNIGQDEQKYYDTMGELSYRAPRADIIRSERSQNILNNMSRPEWLNDTLNFAYQTGMSMADSATAMAFAYAGAPWMVDAMFFSSAGNSAYREARAKGATQDQSMLIGVLSGTAEALFEHVSIEHFMKMDYKGKNALIKNLFSQAIAEGSEEVTTEIANTLSDAWVMMDKSEYNQSVKEYISQGMTEEQAKNKAFLDQLYNIGMAGFGGAVSGALFGLGGALVSNVSYKKAGNSLRSSSSQMQQYTDLAHLLGGEPMEYLDQYTAEQTDTNAGKLKASVDQQLNEAFGGKEAPAVSKVDAMNQETAAPRVSKPGNQMDLDAAVREQVVDKATAYSALLSGDKMNAATAQTVMDVIGAEQLQKMGYDTSSPMKLMSSYNKRLNQYGIKSRSEALSSIRQQTGIRDNYRSAGMPSQQKASSMGMVRTGSALEQTQQRAAEAGVTRAENNATNRVWANPTQGLAQTVNGRTVTPMPGNLTAVSFAEQQRNNFKANATATTGKVTYAVAGMQARAGMSNEQTLSEIKKSMTKEARAKANFYEKLSKALGLKMTIHDVMVGTNGFIDENGNMHVVLSGKQSVLRVAAHELTHYMKENAAGHYAELRKHLIADVGQETFDRMVRQKAREYGIDLSTEKGKTIADDEVCAELCERMLSNEDAIERFAEKNTAAAKTLKDHLLKILNAIKSALKDAKNRDFGESWSDMVTDQETIEKWITGIDAAIQNAEKRAQTTEGQIGKVAGVTSADQEELISDIKNAKTDAEADEAFAEHSVDIIEHDMAGYRQDLVNAGIMTKDELDSLFDTMNKAVDKVKMHRAILDFGFQLSEKAQNDPELAEKEIAEAKAGRSYLPYKQNADPHYKLALDFSTLCKKRILLQMIQERLQGKLGRALSALETIAVRREIQKLQKNGVDVEVACALCYVEAARLKSPKVINEFLGVDQADRTKNVEAEMKNYFAQKDKDIKKEIEKEQKKWKVKKLGADWRGKDKKGRTITAEKATKDHLKAFGGQALVDEFNKDSKDFRTGNLVSDALKREQQAVIDEAKRLVRESPETFLSADSLAKLKKSNPDIFYAFTNKVRSATRSKALETDTFYSRGDIDMVEEAIIRTANQESGFRHQSWSDFMPIHLLDTMASVIEMSQRGAKMHAYTKVPEMVRLLGNTGMMLNLSLIPSGETGLVDGKLDFDSTEGMDYNTMLKLRDMFPNTVGNIAIGISDDQIKQLLQSDDIDYVIPYHVSGLNKQLRTHMGIHTWLDFTSSQNESAVSKEWEDKHKKGKMKPPALAAWFDEKAAKAAESNGVEYMQQAAQKYLDICARDGWVPKFSQYLDYDEKTNKYTPKAGYENYWKTLTDRKMVNQDTGEVIIQQAVKPKFDQDTVMDILNGEAENPTAIRNAAVADEIANELGKTWRADKENANLKEYGAELNAFREASAVMAADRVKEDVQKRLAEMRNSRYSLDLDELSDIDDGVRHSLDTQKGHREAVGLEPVAYKPAGKAPRAREIRVPQVAKNGKRVSDFTRSFLESNKVTDEIANEMLGKVESGEWGGYTRLTNEEAMNRAKDYIAKVQVTKAQQDFHDMVMSGKYNVNTRALGLQLLTEAAQRGDKVALLDIASDLRVLATDAGQSVQIFSVLKDLGGVGSAWYLNKVVERLNTKYADQIADGKMSEITVPEELMTQLEQASTTQEVTAAEKAISKVIADQLPLTWADRLSNWRYMAMLANPTTHARNLFGNLLMGGMNKAKDAVAAGIERIGVRDQSKRTHAVLTAADKKTWGDFAEQSYNDNEGLLRGNGKFSFESEIKQNMRSFDTKALNAIAQFNFNALENEDMWFIKPAYKNALMQYMKAQGYTIQNGVVGKMVDGKFKATTKAQTAQAVEYASEQAWKATFHDASALADMLNKISKMNTASKLLVEGVMPFRKTPINIAKRGIEYSPAGIVMGLVQLGRDVKKGKVTTAHAIDNLASGITGTALMAIGMFLSKAGLIKAEGDDDKKKATYLQDTGDQTYSLKIGKYSFSLSSLAPATIPLFMGAALQEKISGSGDLDLSTITDTISGALNPFMEMSFMSSLNSALKNYGNEGIGGALGNTVLTSAENYFSQYLPTVTAKAGQFADPTVRTTKSSATSPIGSGMDYYARSLLKKVPGAEALLQPDVDVWGRETKKDSFQDWALDFANKFIFPAYVKVSNKDAVDDEMIRVVESTGNTDFLPSDGKKKFTVKGEDYPMTAAQYTEFSKDRGTASYAALKETMSSDAYRNADDEQKATMLTNALEAAQKQVNTVWKEKLGVYDAPPVEETKQAAAEAPNVEEKPKTEVQSTQGDYSDPALYKVAASYPNAYDRAAKAKAKGISPDTFLELYEKRDKYSGDDLSSYVRQEIMNSNLTAKQKEFMDDLIVSDKGWNPDYSSKAWFDVSMLGNNSAEREHHYNEAKEGEKIGMKPETYVQVYNKWKTLSGKTKQHDAKAYLDSLAITAPVYDYIWYNVFNYKTAPGKVK